MAPNSKTTKNKQSNKQQTVTTKKVIFIRLNFHSMLNWTLVSIIFIYLLYYCFRMCRINQAVK